MQVRIFLGSNRVKMNDFYFNKCVTLLVFYNNRMKLAVALVARPSAVLVERGRQTLTSLNSTDETDGLK